VRPLCLARLAAHRKQQVTNKCYGRPRVASRVCLWYSVFRRVALATTLSSVMPTNANSKPEPLQIPLPGGSGQVPTGAIQFQNDWPGLVLRGDTAVGLAVSIRDLEKAFADHPDPIVWSGLSKLSTIAAIIERDVQAR
jgi:hypothetical protein